MLFYSLALGVGLALAAPWWLWRMATSGRYREGLAARLGVVPEELRAAVQGKRTVWLHAVSVGEVLAAERLIAELREALPGVVIAVSTTTGTGQKIAGERLGTTKQGQAGCPVFYFPLDFRFAVRAYLEVLRPELMVLVESEFWPRHLVECERLGVPVAVVNARVSDRSFPRYMRLRWLWKPLLAKVSLFLAQGDETAERLVAIGAPKERVRVSGNLKFDLRDTGANTVVLRLRELLGGRELVVAGSTLPGEEETVLRAWEELTKQTPGLALVIAPRHPQRFREVEDLLWKTVDVRLQWIVVSSEEFTGPGWIDDGVIFLLDTLGDLAAMYGIADVAFVGGSLVAKGGHNPLEPARFGVPVVMGPSYENFREIVDGMRAADGIRIVEDEGGLAATLIELLTDGEAARALGERGRQVFEEQSGATGRTVAALVELMAERGR